MENNFSEQQKKVIDIFEGHVNAEINGDIEKTMETMTDDPHITIVPNLGGGVGKDGVRNFYNNHLIGQFFPPDTVVTTISKTIDEHQFVEEQILSFTHTQVLDWMLPGIAPTFRKVSLPLVVIVGLKDGKVSHEHIYWDNASLFFQLGLIATGNLPICGAEAAQALLDSNFPRRVIAQP